MYFSNVVPVINYTYFEYQGERSVAAEINFVSKWAGYDMYFDVIILGQVETNSNWKLSNSFLPILLLILTKTVW